MKFALPQALSEEINSTIELALGLYGMINVPVLAEEVRSRNVDLNVAIEDIEYAVVEFGRIKSAVMMFDRRQVA